MNSETDYACSVCDYPAEVVRGTYKFAESGLTNVTLCNIELIQCPYCGNADPIIPHLSDLMRVIALALIQKPSRLEGLEVRFLRKFLHKTGDDFGRLLGVDKTTVSKWENGQDVGPASDRLIRAVVLNLGDGLLENARAAVERFPCINDDSAVQEITVDSETREYEYA